MLRLMSLVVVWDLVLPSSLQAQPVSSTSLAFGTVGGRPGEIVEIPLLASFVTPLLYFAIVFEYDFDRLEYREFVVDGTVAAAVDPLGVSYRTYGPGEAFCGVFATRTSVPTFRIPPGADVLIGKLRFRIRGAADAGLAEVRPVQRVSGTVGSTVFVCDEDLKEQEISLNSLTGGGVNIAEPEGPRPIDDLVCGQILDRIEFSFRPTDVYDEILVRRDRESIAVLPGSATSFTDPLPGLGAFGYAMVGRRGGDDSVSTDCEVLATSPAAPAVEELRCDGEHLTWSNPIAYETITVFRGAETIARLPGDMQAFRDANAVEGTVVYSVVGELEGYRGPEVYCLSPAVWIVEAGDVQVPVDAEQVVVSCYVTTSAPAQAISFCLELDMSRLDLVDDRDRALAGTVGYPEPEYFESHLFGPGCAGPLVALAYDMFPAAEPEKDLPVGLRQHVINFVFETSGTFEEGESIPIRPGETSFTARYPSKPFDIRAVFANAFIPGQIRFGSGGIDAVASLEARVTPRTGGEGGGGSAPREILLTWENRSAYGGIRIERNGTVVAEIDGDTTSYLDASVPPGVFMYKVFGISGEETSYPASAFVSTISPRGSFLRGDANRDGRVDIADPIVTLEFLFRGGAGLPCEDAGDADDDGHLRLTDAIVMLQHLFLGRGPLRAPGSAYPWFDPTLDGLTCRE